MAVGFSTKGINLAQFLLLIVATHLNYIRCQDNEQISYTMREQVPYNTPIGNVIQDSNLRTYPSMITDSFQFGLLQGRHNNYFQISNDGDFTTADPLNREDVCPSLDTCEILVKAAILRPTEYFTEITLRITVEDRNDYTPTFPQSKLVINMSESTLPGAEFVIPPAIDLDSTRFAIQSYEILPPVAEFELLIISNSDGTEDLRLKLKERLDRERNARYSINIVVYDGGVPPKTSAMEIEVNLVDHNDNSPVFDQSLYNVTIDEDFSLNTNIVQVHATDRDDGPNGLVRYSLAAQTRAMYGDLFRIDSSTGELTLGGHLNYEEHTLYTVLIEANDHGVGSLPAIAKIYLHIRDVNDHEPLLTISGLSPSGNIEIAENSNSGINVAHIAVEDLDTGRNGEIECSTPSNNDFIMRERPSNTFMLVSLRSFDYEMQQSYNLPVVCNDHGSPQLSTSIDITITIVDENDNSPIFDTNNYALRFRENNTIGETVLHVTATDLDSGNNGRISYVLNDNLNDYVRVNPDTGAIHANTVFDYESIHSYTFTVAAFDNGIPRRNDSSVVTLTLVDINDEVPKFSHPSYSFGTYENQDIGTEIYTIQATDGDSPPFDSFVFTLDTRSNAHNVFDINPFSGEITTKQMLDREHIPAYNLTVVATNTAFPRLSSSVPVTVYVVDRNDNAPLISFPNLENNTVQVASSSARGSIFTRIIARDSDSAQNAQLRFSIASGNEEGLFNIDSVTGALAVEKELTEAESPNYQLLIMVEDMGKYEQKSAVTTLHIYINKTVIITKSPRSQSAIQDSHKMAIIILGAVTAVLVVILVTAIIVIKRRQAVNVRNSTESMYKVDVSHNNGGDAGFIRNDKAMQENMMVVMDKPSEDQGGVDRTHLTLEDIKRMKCLYRNTPDVTRHTPMEEPETRAHVHNQGQGQAYNVRKNAEMQGIFDLLSEGEGQPVDDESTDSNADSGRGTSEAGNDVSAQKLNLSDDSPAVISRQGVLTPVHMYLKDKPNVSRQKLKDNMSTFGSHLNRHGRTPSSHSDLDHSNRKQHHVTFDLSNQNQSSLPHTQYNNKNTTTVANQPFQRTHSSINSRLPANLKSQNSSSSPYIDMTQTSRGMIPVYSNPSEMSESCDNVSLASTTSGEYIVQMDNGPLQSVEV